jgi:hypothetical protein
LRDDDGKRFGLGDDGDQSFWVEIVVVETDKDIVYDFALNFCDAKWSSETGKLPCPGSTKSEDGFVVLLTEGALENRYEDELILWMHPNENRNGWIKGVYPYYKVQDGDHFRTWVGCLEGNDRCVLTFRLDYMVKNGGVNNLGEWTEIYDGEFTNIDIDLSDMEGLEVKFILSVTVNNQVYEDANAFWFVPRIQNDVELLSDISSSSSSSGY